MHHNKHKAKKAIIMARVSSIDQADNYSIASQIKAMQDYCKRAGLEIIKEYKLVESSTRGDRKQFMQMIDFAKQQKEITAIISYAVDRFQRRQDETVMANQLCKEQIIELYFIRESLLINIEAKATNIMQWGLATMMAENQVLILSENVKRGMSAKRESGEWCHQAPLGYKNIRGDNGRPTVVIDEARALNIKRLFQNYSTGNYSMNTHLKDMAKQWKLTTKQGKGLSTSVIQNILTNPFYYGYMRVKGELLPHVHEKIITKSLFDTCQAVMNARSNRQKPRASKKHNFIFNGLLRCANTQRVVTCDIKKGKYTYLICFDESGKKRFIPEPKVLEQVEEVFEEIAVPKKLLKGIYDTLKQSSKAEQQLYQSSLKQLEKRKNNVKSKKDRLLDVYLEQGITQEQYNQKLEAFNNELELIEDDISQLSAADDNFYHTISSLATILSQASTIFKSSKNDKKRDLIGFVFSNLQLDGPNLCYSLRKPFDMLVEIDDFTAWQGQ